MVALVADLEAEQGAIQSLLEGIGEDDWLRPTPAEGWDVRDSVSHLADTDEIAIDTLTGGPRSFELELERHATPDDFTLWGCRRGREQSGPEVLAWWRGTSARERQALLDTDATSRVPWGLGMVVPTLVTARMMETWAHGLDIHAGLGAEPADTDRLRHVAWLSVKALPYAFQVAGRAAPDGELRVELELPSGASWTFGPDGADDLIAGPASQFCRVFVQRMPRSDAVDLVVRGPLAEAALAVARAYL